RAGPVTRAAPAVQPVAADPDGDPAVYRVARGDHLGTVAQRYLDDFGDYRELAALNRLADPDRIHPGQLLKLPQEAEDRGARRHATGPRHHLGRAVHGRAVGEDPRDLE
ncbi:LysM peptidoglycan-binding domain-containing protein, partial [Micromonospora sp. URMC 106]|uniref:LysM peptidoglycan-binding domain-containing protein n=1 Tax=Micromonospora sp. URMC 106 TaxID=3423408 RepID=UPI003F1B52F8